MDDAEGASLAGSSRTASIPIAGSSSLDQPSFLLRTPSQSSFTTKRARLARNRSSDIRLSISDINLAHLSTSADAQDHLKESLLSKPPLSRHTTYSSLPPSPRIEAALDFGVTDPVITLQNLESALNEVRRRRKGKTRASSDEDGEEAMFDMDHSVEMKDGTPESDDAGGADVEAVEDTFWPAQSRRQTLVTKPDLSGLPRLSRKSTSNGVQGLNIDMKGLGADFGSSQIDSENLESPETLRHDGKGSTTGAPEETMSIAASLWDILKDEAGEEVWDGWVADGKWERIANFLAVPFAVEKLTLFGALLCLDGFLYNFTVLPIRATFAVFRFCVNSISQRDWSHPVPPSHLHSILRLLLVVIPTGILLLATDASKMYHSVRGQDTIKLYVIFNALEIADRLCGAFGQDVLDTLFARETLTPSIPKRGKGRRRQRARPYFFFTLALGYVMAHTLIFFYMLVSLNVAINSYDYTLLSLLISNQFVEIKGSVFKKFERENLFQIMCADIVERFQLGLMLTVIGIRNTIEMAGSDIAFLPKSFMRGKSLADAIFSPVIFVILSEMLVDWLKHAFITKFNHVRASVYGRFTDVLAKDVLVAGTGPDSTKGRRHPILLDQSPLVARRLGFASIPLVCLVLRVGAQAFGMLTMSSPPDDTAQVGSHHWIWAFLKWTAIFGLCISAWLCLVALKILLGLGLLGYSAGRQAHMEATEHEDEVNDFGRSPVGESKEESDYNKVNSVYLDNVLDDLTPAFAVSPKSVEPDGGHPTPRVNNDGKVAKSIGIERGGNTGAGRKGKKWKLEEVERWTMVKRIW